MSSCLPYHVRSTSISTVFATALALAIYSGTLAGEFAVAALTAESVSLTTDGDPPEPCPLLEHGSIASVAALAATSSLSGVMLTAAQASRLRSVLSLDWPGYQAVKLIGGCWSENEPSIFASNKHLSRSEPLSERHVSPRAMCCIVSKIVAGRASSG